MDFNILYIIKKIILIVLIFKILKSYLIKIIYVNNLIIYFILFFLKQYFVTNINLYIFL